MSGSNILAESIVVRRFVKEDQDSACRIYRDGFSLYHELGPDITLLQKSFVSSKLSVGGDMFDIFTSYKLESDECETKYNFWVATLEGESIILGCLGIIPSDLYDDGAELVRMSVDSQYRKLGVATKLLDAACQWMIRKGLGRLHLRTLTVMTPAIRLYTKYGFELTHTEEYIPEEDLHL
eukprot:gene44194-58949_t